MKTYLKTPTPKRRVSVQGTNPFKVKKLAFSKKAFDQIRGTVGSRPAESGGALYGFEEDLCSPIPYVRDFVFDKGLNASRVDYQIDHVFVNENNVRMWNEHEKVYYGQLHSHPYGCKELSQPDLEYFEELHQHMKRPYLVCPVVFTQPDGGFRIFVYLIGPDPLSPPYEVEYSIMDESEYKKERAALEAEAAINSLDEKKDVASTAAVEEITIIDEPETAGDHSAENGDIEEKRSEVSGTKDEFIGPKKINYARIEDALDVKKLHGEKIVIVGCGGTYLFTNMCVRSGVRNWVFIDPDKVDDTNLCRQGYLPRQFGMYKVEALAETVCELDPEAKCEGYAKRIQDLTFEEVEHIFSDAALIIAATDSTNAQIFMNKVALRYKVPTIWGGFYEKSLAMEIFFYIPGVTPGCYSCALWPRIQYQKEYMAQHEGQEYRVSSGCNTIFHSALLDAEMGMLAMAILHNKVEGKTFSGWFGDRFDRNFIQMKVNPAYESSLFTRTFESAGDNAFLFESVWQLIEPDAPDGEDHCPACHTPVIRETGHGSETNAENSDKT